MSRRWLRVFAAIFSGTLVGGSIALDTHLHHWWLGVLIGGATGGMLSALFQAIPALPSIWRTTVWQMRATGNSTLKLLLRVRGRLSYIPFIALAAVDSGLWAWIAVKVMTMPLAQSGVLFSVSIVAGTFFALMVFFGACGFVCTFAALFSESGLGKEEVYTLRAISVVGIPPVTIIALVFIISVGVWDARKKIIAGAISVVVFLRTFFVNWCRFIHAHEVVVCALWSAAGSYVIYARGGLSILGLALGAAAGVLYFEVVSVRLFKLVPRAAAQKP